jgi:ubiquitin-protein ligase
MPDSQKVERISHFIHMTAPGLQRKLLRELKAIHQEGRNDYSVRVVENNIAKWNVVLLGPTQTTWDGAVLHLTIEFPLQYPISAPDVRFTGVIPFHPNVYGNGKICLDLLQHNWSAAYGIDGVMTALQALLQSPNSASPANSVAAELFEKNNAEYRRRVRKCVESTWMPEAV